MFQDRTHAGQELAEQLEAYRAEADVLVFGLSRGGVPVAYEVAKSLNAPLDVLVVRKLGVPGHKELAMGAIAPDNISFKNTSIIEKLSIPAEILATVEDRERAELVRREQLYRGSSSYPALSGKTVILADDGLATGSTMRAAVKWAKCHDAKEVTVAVPVASIDACQEIELAEGVNCICALTPQEFSSVGSWYQDFSQVSDNELTEILKAYARKLN